MEKGISKYWTEEKERFFRRLLENCGSFAEWHTLASMIAVVKYDLRTKAGRQARAQIKLRLATATDADLEELAKLDYEMLGESYGGTVPERIAHLKAVRSNIRVAGIKPSVLKLEGTSLKGDAAEE